MWRAVRIGLTAPAKTLEPDIGAALAEHGVTGITALGLALHFQVVLQGAFVLAKSQDDAGMARESVRHLKRYVTMLCKGEA